MKRDFKTFHIYTVADWVRCEIPDRPPDYYSFSGSAYWDYKTHVRRLSDHWGKVASCKWYLEGEERRIFTCSLCYYDEFRSVFDI